MYLLEASEAASGGGGIGLWIALGVGAMVLIWFVITQGSLVKLKQEVKSAWAQIDVQLQRRYDLIPNLVEVAKKYMAHEKEVLENVTKARAGAMAALNAARQSGGGAGPALAVGGGDAMPDLANAEVAFTGAMRSFMLNVENYPELKASTNMSQLHEELTSTENKLSFSRQYYNETVRRYNTKIDTIPSNMVASIMRYKKATFFEIADRETIGKAPKVQF